MSPQGDVKPLAEEDLSRPSNSFVYPVRSLLSGIRAQPGTTLANAAGSVTHGECTPATVAEKDLDIDIKEDRIGAHAIILLFLGSFSIFV